MRRLRLVNSPAAGNIVRRAEVMHCLRARLEALVLRHALPIDRLAPLGLVAVPSGEPPDPPHLRRGARRRLRAIAIFICSICPIAVILICRIVAVLVGDALRGGVGAAVGGRGALILDTSTQFETTT